MMTSWKFRCLDRDLMILEKKSKILSILWTDKRQNYMVMGLFYYLQSILWTDKRQNYMVMGLFYYLQQYIYF